MIIPRPPNFKFKSGDYLFIKVPKIARYEWHPFTISSAPDLKGLLTLIIFFIFFSFCNFFFLFCSKDELWLHVRSLGNWTNKLYEYFQDVSKNQIDQMYYIPARKNGITSETRYERRKSQYVVMVDYKKNSTISQQTDEIRNGSDSYNQNRYKKNLNISNNIKNIWMEVY